MRDPEKALAYGRQAMVNRSWSVLRHWTLAPQRPATLPDTSAAQSGVPSLLEQPAACEVPEVCVRSG
jgi:hypothetical protein